MTHRAPTPNKLLYLVLILYVCLAVAYSSFVPLFEAPDETAHVDYVRFLRAEGRLPEQGQAGEAHQPPLYYLLAALASLPAHLDHYATVVRTNPDWVWAGVGQDVNVIYHTDAEAFPWQGAALAIHLMRIVSVLLGMGTVWVMYRIGREIFPHSHAVPLGAAAFVAFNPQFVFISSVVNNDNLAILCAAVATWMLVRLLLGCQSRWTLLGLGLSLGAGLMAKQSLLVVLPVAALVLAYASLRARNPRLIVEGGFIVAGLVVLTTGWWYWRNQALYGELFGINAFLAHRPEEVGAKITDWATLCTFADKMHRSFWGLFGWMNVPLPEWVYWALASVCLAALGGGAAALRSHKGRSPSWAVWVLLASLPALFVFWVVTYGYRFGGSGWQGRYLFPALPTAALLLAAGLAGYNWRRGQAMLLGATAVGLLTVTIWSLPGVIRPAYVRVTHPLSDLERAQQALNVNFGNLIRLAGYDLDTSSTATGPTTAITLYWEAIDQPAADYKVFVHFVDLSWNLHGQGDGYPLDGRFPTLAWKPGDVVIDRHKVEFQGLVEPGEYRIGLGWYLEATGERLPILREGQEVGTVAETLTFHLD